jgi:hypothetical protein
LDAQIIKSNEVLAGSEELRERPAQRKLARAHYLVLSQMAANPQNPLRKLQGGFWVVDPDVDEYQAGEWYASTNAVSVLIKLGYVQPIAQSSALELTPAGIEALKTGLHTP